MNHLLRLVTTSDSEAILNIYAPYIRHTTISFETDIPTINEFSTRINAIYRQYPYLVYLIDGKIIGYAYASNHRTRAAYNYDVDTSIYISPEYHSLGIASRLYNCLFEILRELGYYNAYAGIAVPNKKSVLFHKKHDFVTIGTYHKTGYKFNRWHDVLWLEKVINKHCVPPNSIQSIHDLNDKYLSNLFLSYAQNK